MNEKGKILAVVGLVIALSGFVFNEIFMMFIRMDTNNPVRPEPHSGPIIAGTPLLNLIPIGMMFLFIALVLEIVDRSHRTDTTEIWEQ